MIKYIDAEAFKRRILSYGIVHEGDRIPIPYYKHYFAEAFVAILRWVCEEVDDTPAADVAEVRHGKWNGYNTEKGWLRDDGTPVFLVCSECNGTVLNNGSAHWNYCPNCGSRMDLEGEEE